VFHGIDAEAVDIGFADPWALMRVLMTAEPMASSSLA
jgi:hypothetical protein